LTMAAFRVFLLFVTVWMAHAKMQSKKYFKARTFPFAYPVDVCYPRQVDATYITSIKLTCEEDPTDCPLDGSECVRMLVAQRFNTVDCSGSITSTDRFKQNGRREYPFTCYEQEELDDETFTADVADYETSYVVVKMTKGIEVEEEGEGGNVTSCEADPNADFYRTFPAITDRCIMGWRDVDGTDTPEWHLTRCHETAVEVRTFENKRHCTQFNDALDVNGTNFTALPQPMFTLYSDNGCDGREWQNETWYTEVLECTHPDYTISSGAISRRAREGVYVLMALTFVMSMF